MQAWSDSAIIGKIFTDFAPLFKAYCDYARVRDVTLLGYVRATASECVRIDNRSITAVCFFRYTRRCAHLAKCGLPSGSAALQVNQRCTGDATCAAASLQQQDLPQYTRWFGFGFGYGRLQLRSRSVEFVNFEAWHKGTNHWFTLESELIKPMQHTVRCPLAAAVLWPPWPSGATHSTTDGLDLFGSTFFLESKRVHRSVRAAARIRCIVADPRGQHSEGPCQTHSRFASRLC